MAKAPKPLTREQIVAGYIKMAKAQDLEAGRIGMAVLIETAVDPMAPPAVRVSAAGMLAKGRGLLTETTKVEATINDLTSKSTEELRALRAKLEADAKV
jgi:hypothetical protein